MTYIPKTLTVEETESLFSELADSATSLTKSMKAIRNRVMILLMLDAGLRVNEVANLKISDLWFRDGPVTSLIISIVISKNNTERIVPLTPRLQKSIEYLNKGYWLHFEMKFEDPAFTASRRTKPITTRQIQRIVEQVSFQALGKKIHPHMLRHTFATRLMRKTNIRVVQQLLGHKALTSTQVYTHPNNDDLTDAIKNLNI